MIVSASYRTDIPAYYGAWFLRRLASGYCRVASPFGGKPAKIDLHPHSVAGFVFWTRNIGPFRPALEELSRQKIAFVAQFTVTGYPRALEPGTIDSETAIGQAKQIANEFGRRALVWRYDPIVISDLTPVDYHRRNFAALARALEGASDEVVISFVQAYRKTRRGLDAAAAEGGFAWRDPPAEEKRDLVARLGAIAAERGMALTICAQPDHLIPGIRGARCIDALRLGDVAGRAIEAREKGNRPFCLCHESRDIGAYDSCAQGCVYCYAVGSRDLARARLRAHDPAGEFLIPPGA